MDYYKRGFLNKTKGTAAFECSVYQNSRVKSSIYASFSISDCSKKVTLDFDIYNKKEDKLVIYKLNKLIEELSTFREKVQQAIDNRENADEG